MAQMKSIVIGAVGTGSVFYIFGLSLWSVLGVLLLWFLLFGGVNFLKSVVKTGPRDLWLASRLLSFNAAMRTNARNRITILDLFEQTVRKHPQKVAIIFEDEKWSFQQLDEYANRVANYFLTLGIKKGDVVAVFMENCPEYVGTWVGLGKIGVVSAFINYNLRHDALAHSIKVSKASAVVFTASLGEALDAVQVQLDDGIRAKCFAVKKSGTALTVSWDAKDLQTELSGCASSPPPPPKDKGFEDHLCYIYTSGTTGLPKAVVIKHRRFFHMAWGHGLMLCIMPTDVLYCTLPLYHSNGGVVCLGSMLLRGCTLVLRKKFSASNFWIDCIKYKCTVVYYIGEICRYLLAQPPRPTDAQHCVRMATGNGLRPNLWKQFQTRFNVTEIGEFYGSTEGNITVVNTTNKEGAVGNLSVIVPFVYPVTLLKVDPETGQLIRDSNGYCVKASFNEPGEIVGKIDKTNHLRQFDGYHDNEASEKKILRNVFTPGDAYFLSGDILRMDEEGYLYFCDRTGDTFRWKGENVSTAEVESVITNVMEHRDACVYGVDVPGSEGKAGMAAIVGEKSLDVSQLAQKLYSLLPVYAVPIFIRVVPSVDLTGTFKIQKNRIRSEGFNIDNVSDPLYVLDVSERKYVSLDAVRYKQLTDGLYRL